jgi:SPP1 gp7 family putative phage head morphogenesis protein
VNHAALTTAREVELRRRLFGDRARRRRKRLPRAAPPRGIAREYARELVALVRKLRPLVEVVIEQLPGLLEEAKRERGDAAREDAVGRRVRELLERMASAATAAIQPTAVEALAQQFALKTSTYQRKQLQKQTRAALGADVFARDPKLTALFEMFAAENAALITNVSQTVVNDVSRLVTRGVSSGRLHRDLARDLRERVGFGEKRAKLIARDQVGKMYGATNAARQKELGVTHFFWRTSNDERVREEHADLEGERFSYADGGHPDEGMPGEPILCRCYAEPDFSDILAETD